MSNESLLIVVLALPFAGSLAAGLFPANARNREAWLAGAVALANVAVSQQSSCPVDHAGHIDLRNLAPVGQHR